MRGHDLGPAARYTIGSKSIFRAVCQCGLAVYGPRLPAMWAAHDVHLGVVRVMAPRNPPGHGGPGPASPGFPPG